MSLPGPAALHLEEGSVNIVETFRRLYFHLYGNSEASRAERIAGDLCLLLLLKAAVDRHGMPRSIERYLAGKVDESDGLLPVLRRHYPALVAERGGFALKGADLRAAAIELLSLNLGGAPAHSLGDAFQALVGPRLRGDRGQFFTPRSLVRAVVTMVAPGRGDTVVDPACGTGGFLAEAHTYRLARGAAGPVIGRDKDADMVGLATALLELVTSGSADVRRMNALDLDAWNGGDHPALGAVEVVLTNPPFGTKIGIRDPEILAGYELGHLWRAGKGWSRTDRLLDAQDPQVLFLELAVRLLRPGGRLAIVLPEGMFGNRRQGYVWSWLEACGHVEALLDCPRTTFQPGTDIKTNVLVFRRATAAAMARRRPVKVAVAHHCGHDRRGRTHGRDGRPHPDDFGILAACYERGGDGWSSVDLRGGHYYVPRYHVPAAAKRGPEGKLVEGARRVRLRELVEDGILSVRKGHEVGARCYGTGEIPFVRTSDLSNHEVRTDPTKAVSLEVYERYRGFQELAADTVLLVADGRYRIGTSAILGEADLPCVVQSHLRIFRVLRPEELDPYELLFALNLAETRAHLQRLVFVQSTLGTLGERLWELELPLLHGDGPWRQVVDRFRTILRQRRSLLAELAGLAPAEEDP